MPYFCEMCHNLLLRITTVDKFYYLCGKCREIYQPGDDDTMMYGESSNTSLVMHKTILQNAGHDPANPKEYRTCGKCKNNIVRQIRIGENKKLINICTKCDEKWIEGLQ